MPASIVALILNVAKVIAIAWLRGERRPARPASLTQTLFAELVQFVAEAVRRLGAAVLEKLEQLVRRGMELKEPAAAPA